MRQSHSEIKAIEAELRSIRADSTSPPARSVTLLDPHQPNSSPSIASHRPPESKLQPISPTIVRQSPPARPPQSATQPPQKQVQKQVPNQGQQVTKRSIECFPFPAQQRQHPNSAVALRQSQLAAVVEQLRQQAFDSEYGARHNAEYSSETSSRLSKTSTESRQEKLRQMIEQRAQSINQLSTHQEALILELMEILEQTEQNLELDAEPLCECLTAEVPHVERERNGALVLTTRSIDWFKPEASTAAALRYRARQQKRSSLLHSLLHFIHRLGRTLWRLPWGILRLLATASAAVFSPVIRLMWGQSLSAKSTAKRNVRRAAMTPHYTAPYHTTSPSKAEPSKVYRGSGRRASAVETPFTLKSAALLIVSSALLRIGLDWVVSLYPMLWMPSILIMLAPALMAVYRSTIMPQTGFVWGYRLFAILIGLLLGGRL